MPDKKMTDDGEKTGVSGVQQGGRPRLKSESGLIGRFWLYLGVGMVLVFSSAWVLFGVAGNIVGTDLIRWDAGILHALQKHRTAALDQIMLFFTTLGNWQTVLWGMICAAVILSLRNRRHAVVALVVSVAGGSLFVTVMKEIVQRPRPPAGLALTQAWSYSFPSGHGFAAFSFYGLITYFLFRSLRGAGPRILALLGGVTLAAGIGSSRVYLGVHWPSDVFASCAAGIVWLAAVIVMLESRSDKARRVDPTGRGAVFVCWLCFFLWVGYAAVSTRRQHIEPAHMKMPARERVQRGGYASPVTFVSIAYMQSRQVA